MSSASMDHEENVSPQMGTIVIYVDGRRLGLMFSQEDLDLGDGDIPPLPIWPLGFKWCGVLSAGAELRISGPKPPASG